MAERKKVLLKITGEIFKDQADGQLSSTRVRSLAQQIKTLRDTFSFSIVIGGGCFFRGSQQGVQLGISSPLAHQVGMLATVMNGLILQDLCAQEGLETTVLCATPVPGVGDLICPQAIYQAQARNTVIIFTGGTGAPFLTTDTTAVIRALQCGAQEVWKGTGVDGVYEQDPRVYRNACLLKEVSLKQAINDHIGIMDATAYALALQHGMMLRVFNIFADQALISAAQSDDFGSIIR
jgi:uridylate kinase